MYRLRVERSGPAVPGPRELERVQQEALRDLQRRTANEARERVAVATGAARRSIVEEPVEATANGYRAAVSAGGTGAPHARWLEFGTGVFSVDPDSPRQPIVIVPVRRKALAWPRRSLGPRGGPNLRLSGALRTHVRRKLQRGQLRPSDVFVFARRVVQQGQLPRPFLGPAFAAVQREAVAIIRQHFARLRR